MCNEYNMEEIADSKVKIEKVYVNEEASCSFLLDTKGTPDISEYVEDLPQSEDNQTSLEQISVTKLETGNDTNNFKIPDMPEIYKATYQSYLDEINTITIPILETVTPEYIKNFKFFNFRYYEDKYSVNFSKQNIGYSDMLIRIHTNKLMLISLASGNDVIMCNKQIVHINFMVNNVDRSDIKLGGKRKKGAKTVESDTILCQVKCEGIEKLFNIRAGVPGRILEINELVKSNPNLLREEPKGNGFLAILAPKGAPYRYESTVEKLKLLSENEYIDYLSKRTPKFTQGTGKNDLENKE